MNNLNSLNVFFLTMISFLGSITIFALSFYYPKSMFYTKNKSSHLYSKIFPDNINYSFHLTNNKSNISIKDNNTYIDITGFHDSSFLNKYENESEIQKEEKNLRKLSLFDFNYFNIAIIANFFSFFLCFFLFISFFIEENECETFCKCLLFYLRCECCKCKCCDDFREECCKCKCCKDEKCCQNGGPSGNMECEAIVILILFVIAIIIVILIIYGIVLGTIGLTNQCGNIYQDI